MRTIKLRVVRLIVFCLSLVLVSEKAFSNDKLSCQYVHPIMQAMLKNHILYSNLTSHLETRTVEGYLKSVDPGKVYFTSADVEQISNLFEGIFDDLKKEQCARLQTVHYIYTSKVSDRSNVAKNFLDDSYKIDETITLLIDYDLIPIPTNKEDSDNLFKKRIHLQIANLISADVTLDKAKELVTKRYERHLNSLKDLATEDLYAQWLYIFSRSLDPHTNFMSAPDVDNFQLQMKLAYEGIGAVLVSQEGYVVVDRLIKGGAADVSALINVQDKIVAVAQGNEGEFEPVIDVPLGDVVQLIRGPKGTTVRLKILRQVGGKSVSMIIPLVRDKIKLEEDAAKIRYITRTIDDKEVSVAILELPAFYQDDRLNGRSSSRDVNNLLKEASERNVVGLVLDFSSNGGGSLEESIKTAGLFLKNGNIVRTIGSGENKILSDKNDDISFTKPVVVLNSRFTASASEIVSGALQSYGRAVIVGADHTFGKGTFQTIIPISKHIGHFKITAGMFYIPDGYSTQYRGVESDIVLPSIYSVDSIGERSLPYSLPEKVVKPFISSRETSGAGIWTPITTDDLEILRNNSKKRVDESKEFNDIKEELSNIRKEIKLSDILSNEEKDKKKQNGETVRRLKTDESFREERYLNEPHLKEAIDVLVDLVKINGNKN